MKKVKFAAQIFILAAAFPVLFIAGISSGKKPVDSKNMETPSIKKQTQMQAGEPVCKLEGVTFDTTTGYLLKN